MSIALSLWKESKKDGTLPLIVKDEYRVIYEVIDRHRGTSYVLLLHLEHWRNGKAVLFESTDSLE
jgi:hypothetical protein